MQGTYRPTTALRTVRAYGATIVRTSAYAVPGTDLAFSFVPESMEVAGPRYLLGAFWRRKGGAGYYRPTRLLRGVLVLIWRVVQTRYPRRGPLAEAERGLHRPSLACYALATQCPVPALRMLLRDVRRLCCFVVSGTDEDSAATPCLVLTQRICYAVSGTD
eukprot:2077703-Rhodomonas_salina.1